MEQKNEIKTIEVPKFNMRNIKQFPVFVTVIGGDRVGGTSAAVEFIKLGQEKKIDNIHAFCPCIADTVLYENLIGKDNVHADIDDDFIEKQLTLCEKAKSSNTNVKLPPTVLVFEKSDAYLGYFATSAAFKRLLWVQRFLNISIFLVLSMDIFVKPEYWESRFAIPVSLSRCSSILRFICFQSDYVFYFYCPQSLHHLDLLDDKSELVLQEITREKSSFRALVVHESNTKGAIQHWFESKPIDGENIA